MSYLILNDLKERLVDGFKDWKLEKRGSIRDTPPIYIGRVPPKKGSGPPQFSNNSPQAPGEMPFILLRPINGDLTNNDITDRYRIHIAIILGIYSKESEDQYENGIQIIMNALDKSLFTLNQHQYWGSNRFSLNSDISWGYGIGKTVDPYDCGLQTDGPHFFSVILISFDRELPILKNELNYLI